MISTKNLTFHISLLIKNYNHMRVDHMCNEPNIIKFTHLQMLPKIKSNLPKIKSNTLICSIFVYDMLICIYCTVTYIKTSIPMLKYVFCGHHMHVKYPMRQHMQYICYIICFVLQMTVQGSIHLSLAHDHESWARTLHHQELSSRRSNYHCSICFYGQGTHLEYT